MMLKIITACAAVSLVSTSALAQQVAPQPRYTQTNRILAIERLAPGADRSKLRPLLATEARATVQLYLDGKIDQWYSTEDGTPGAVFILNVTDLNVARQMLEEMPLFQAHLLTIELLMPIGPFNPVRSLMAPAEPVK